MAYENKLPNLIERLHAIQNEYNSIHEARNALQIKTGILIALLTGIVTIVFTFKAKSIQELLFINTILGVFKIIFISITSVLALIALTFYINVFKVREYKYFDSVYYAEPSIEDIKKDLNNNVILAMCKDYTKCILANDEIFGKVCNRFKWGNRFLFLTIFFSFSLIFLNLFC